MPPPPDDREDAFVHSLNNQLAIIIGFSDLMLAEMPADHPHRNDTTEINKAARVALAEVRNLASRKP